MKIYKPQFEVGILIYNKRYPEQIYKITSIEYSSLWLEKVTADMTVTTDCISKKFANTDWLIYYG